MVGVGMGEHNEHVFFSATFDPFKTMDAVQHSYYNRDCPYMWPFEQVHTLYICGDHAQDAFERYMKQHAPKACESQWSPRLMRLFEHGQMTFCGVPVKYTDGGEGYMFVEHEPRRYKG